MAYDPHTTQLVLFGGQDHANNTNSYLGDTWTWTGQTWSQLSPDGEPLGPDACGPRL